MWISFRSSSQSRPLACLERPVPLFLVPSSQSHDIHIRVLICTVSRLSLALCSSSLLLRLNLLQWSIIKNYYRIFFPNCSVANYSAHSHFHCYSQWGWPWSLLDPAENWDLTRMQHHTSLTRCCRLNPGFHANKNLCLLPSGYQGRNTSRTPRSTRTSPRQATPLLWGRNEGKLKKIGAFVLPLSHKSKYQGWAIKTPPRRHTNGPLQQNKTTLLFARGFHFQSLGRN